MTQDELERKPLETYLKKDLIKLIREIDIKYDAEIKTHQANTKRTEEMLKLVSDRRDELHGKYMAQYNAHQRLKIETAQKLKHFWKLLDFFMDNSTGMME